MSYVHQYNKGCSVYPTLMLKFHYRNLRLDALGHEPTYRHKHYTNYQFDSQKLLKKWHEFKIIYYWEWLKRASGRGENFILIYVNIYLYYFYIICL